jgi:hypothetical protein
MTIISVYVSSSSQKTTPRTNFSDSELKFLFKSFETIKIRRKGFAIWNSHSSGKFLSKFELLSDGITKARSQKKISVS